ncbi:MAG: hypothetical protein AB4057_22585 [Crocosphaera sp.]
MQVTLAKKILIYSAVLSTVSMTSSIAKASSFLFDFEDGSLPPESLSIQELPPPADPSIVEFTPDIEELSNGNNVLRLKSENRVVDGGAISSSFLNPTMMFKNVKVSALLNPAGLENGDEGTNDRILLFARLNLDPANADAYVFGIDFEDDLLFLRKIIGGVIPPDFLEEVSFDLDQKESYFAEFTVINNQLTGRLFNNTGTDLLSEIFFIDTDNPIVSAGITGISADISDSFLPMGDDNNNATIDNFSAASVPETNSILGLFIVGVLTTQFVRRR